jgi:hypothetical protein
MEIFRPFYGKNWTLTMFDTNHSTPEVLFWSSLTQLEHLALLFIGNAVVCNPIGPAWRFNFLLCMYGYTGLAGSFRVADGFLRAILYMAVQRKLIPPSEARDIINRLPNDEAFDGAGVNGKMPRIRSSHVADLDTDSQVTDLVGKLDDMLTLTEFLTDPEGDYGKMFSHSGKLR